MQTIIIDGIEYVPKHNQIEVYKEDDLKVGDWVIGWHCYDRTYSDTPWKIDALKGEYVVPVEGRDTGKNNIRKATTEEVKNFLVSQAKEKGFVEGLSLNNIQVPTGGISYTGNIQWQYASYASAYDRLTVHGATIYKDGTWATIKPQKEVVSVGGKFNVVVDGDKIYHKLDDITDFVVKLVGYNIARIGIGTYGDYTATIGDIIFTRTGCQDCQTKLSDWQKVLDVYNKLQK